MMIALRPDHDVDAIMKNMTDDAVFESTSPPAGERHEGAAAVRAAWDAFFAASPTAHFDAEEVITTGDRCVVRWIYTWQDDTGATEQHRHGCHQPKRENTDRNDRRSGCRN